MCRERTIRWRSRCPTMPTMPIRCTSTARQIGAFGHFTAHGVTAYSTLPRAFRLPDDIRSGPVTIAIRMWMDSATPFNSPDAGGLHEPPVLGHASAIAAQIRLDWDDIAHGVGSGFLEMLILLLALIVALSLFWLDRNESAYLWLALVSLVTLMGNAIILLVNFTAWIGQTPSVVLEDVILTPVRIGLWVLFWGYWFRLDRIGRLHREVWGLVLLLAAGTALLRPPLYGQVVPVHAASYLVPFLLVVKLALAALLFWVTYQGIRRQKAEGWMALPAVLLAAISQYQHELRLIHIPTAFSLFGFQISLGTVSTMLSLLLVTVMLSRRFLHSQRKKEQWRLEIEQAQHVQQVLIPEKLPHGRRVDHRKRVPSGTRGWRRFLSDHSGRRRRQRSDCRRRRDRQRIAGGHARRVDRGCHPVDGAARCRSVARPEFAERRAVRPRTCQRHLPDAADCRRWHGHAGQCGTSASLSQRQGDADGGSAATGRHRRTRSFRCCTSS